MPKMAFDVNLDRSEDPARISPDEMVPGRHRWIGMNLSFGFVETCRWCLNNRPSDGYEGRCPGIAQISSKGHVLNAR